MYTDEQTNNCRVERTISQRNYFDHKELVACANGKLGRARLPMPPLLMLDRIIDIRKSSGAYKGNAVGELDIHPDLVFFKSHFLGDPVMPGSLIEEGLRQLTGFYAGWIGCEGRGRFNGCGKVRYLRGVTPNNSLLSFTIKINKIYRKKSFTLISADGCALADDKAVCTVENMKVSLIP